LAEGGGETKEAVGFVRAGEEVGERAGGEGGAFGVFGGLGFGGEGLRLIGLTEGEFGHGGLALTGRAVGAGDEQEDGEQKNAAGQGHDEATRRPAPGGW
jgi:hypothetical protein